MKLKIENLCISSYEGKEILKDINLEINEGEWIGLAGETGSGKTTLLKAILRILPERMFFKKGRIILDGKDLLRVREKEMRGIRGKEISMIIQEPHLYFNPSINIFKQIEEFALSHGMGKDQLRERIFSFLELAGFEEPEKWIKMFPFQLSSGMLQRIGIGMALLHEPKFILADEPTSSLDNVHEKQIINLFRSLKKIKKMGFIFVTHKIDLLKGITEKTAVIYKGHILEFGGTDNLFLEPFHPYTSLLLGKSLFGKYHFRRIENQNSCSLSSFCPSKMKKCEEMPPLFERNGRSVRCWLYE
jgi:oligopeptide transport system ATP-binding protein